MSELIDAVKLASEKWKNAFNSGDAAGCVAQYEEDATMHARPFGTFRGREQIQEFWQNLMDDGYNSVEYVDPELSEIDDSTVLLISGWKMNKASGVIHKEIWAMQSDGAALLREDDFEAVQ